MKSNVKLEICFILFITLGMYPAYAEPIFITVSEEADKIIIDGKWSFETEWKHSSENMLINNPETKIALRTAHDYDNLFFLVDFITDIQLNTHSDRALLCIDSDLDKTEIPNNNDFCFIASLNSNQPVTLQGGSPLGFPGFWKKILNDPDLQGTGGISTDIDRYSKTPHTSYEFKIPIETIGRSDKYGLYIQVYDANNDKFYSWPEGQTSEKYPYISPPNLWGEIISPDKTIPEFNDVIFITIPAFFAIIYLTKKFSLYFNNEGH